MLALGFGGSRLYGSAAPFSVEKGIAVFVGGDHTLAAELVDLYRQAATVYLEVFRKLLTVIRNIEAITFLLVTYRRKVCIKLIACCALGNDP